MRKYGEMNRLGKIRVGFVLKKRGKKRGINGGKQRREGFFVQERSQKGTEFRQGIGLTSPLSAIAATACSNRHTHANPRRTLLIVLHQRVRQRDDHAADQEIPRGGFVCVGEFAKARQHGRHEQRVEAREYGLGTVNQPGPCRRDVRLYGSTVSDGESNTSRMPVLRPKPSGIQRTVPERPTIDLSCRRSY